MEAIKLSAKTRKTGKPNQIRREGLIPVVLYGSGKENQHLSISDSDFIKVYRQAGYNTIIDLAIDDKDQTKVLIYQIEYDPITDNTQHIDLVRVDMTKKVTAKVPLEFIGQSKAVKDLGGVLIENMDELEITCLPGNLPKEFKVDISSLQTFDDAIYIRDLVIGEGLEIEDDGTQVVVTVVPPRSDEELAKLNEDVVEDVESVATEEKKEGEEGAAEGEAGKEEKKE